MWLFLGLIFVFLTQWRNQATGKGFSLCKLKFWPEVIVQQNELKIWLFFGGPKLKSWKEMRMFRVRRPVTQKRTDFFVGVGFVSGLCNLLICVSRLLGNFGLLFLSGEWRVDEFSLEFFFGKFFRFCTVLSWMRKPSLMFHCLLEKETWLWLKKYRGGMSTNESKHTKCNKRTGQFVQFTWLGVRYLHFFFLEFL